MCSFTVNCAEYLENLKPFDIGMDSDLATEHHVKRIACWS